ncbi:uncharacterized protein LOC141661088 [Apium graveolens]|uniref:uncharacterized protein LOC141661088 n=1 Tax=Apium graveolens TaxID=4045 RepID=UPI003D79E31E
MSQGSKSISEFFTAIKSVWDAINDTSPLPTCTCNHCTCNLTKRIVEKQQEQRLIQFMMKLNDNFSVARGNVLMMEPIPAISQAFRLSQTESLAFIAEKRPYDNKFNFRGYSNASQSQRQPNVFNQGKAPNSGNAKRTYYCTHCQISGHSLERCFKVHGYPPGFKFKEKKVAAISQNQLSDSSSNTTDPVISREQYNQLIQLLNNHRVNSNNDTVSTSHAFLAEFQFNLISIHKLCQDLSCEVLFTHDKCILQFPSQRQKVIPLGKIEAGLYSVDAQNHKVTLLDADKSHICNVACLSTIEDVKLWHLRLGHLPFQ